VFNFSKANFDRIKHDLKNSDFGLVHNKNNVNSDWVNWLKIVTNIIKKHTPIIRIKDSSAPVWIDEDVRHAGNQKEALWRRAKATNSSKLWAKFRSIRNKYKNLLTNKYNAFINGMGEVIKDNPKRFWSYFKSKSQYKSLPHVVKGANGSASSPQDKASLFNNYFFSVFTTPDPDKPLPNIDSFQNPSLGSFSLKPKEVFDILINLDTSKAIGYDDMSPRVLKECAAELAPSLCEIFNRSLSQGKLPLDWLKANVIPVFKKNDRESVENYRPVSLLSIPSKVLERCIFNRVFPHIKDKLHPLQHGFIKGRSTATQLLQVFHEVSAILDNAGQIDMVYLDFSKAFDSVSHTLLLHKLQNFGIHGKLHAWTRAYLSSRLQRVTVEGHNSDWLPVISGVPQGSILGPMLFLLYINDMPNVASSCAVALFADDSKVYKRINSVEDCMLLQKDLDSLVQWSETWELRFHPSKCQVLSVTRGKNPAKFNYSMNGTSLEIVPSIKDLGVDIASTLTWDLHIKKIIAKANSKMGMIKRTVGYNAPSKVTLPLYTTLVRSNLEYCSVLWSGTSRHNISYLERVQRHTTKYILNYPEMDYLTRIQTLGLLPLCFRR
jgi:hypothetical protein